MAKSFVCFSNIRWSSVLEKLRFDGAVSLRNKDLMEQCPWETKIWRRGVLEKLTVAPPLVVFHILHETSWIVRKNLSALYLMCLTRDILLVYFTLLHVFQVAFSLYVFLPKFYKHFSPPLYVPILDSLIWSTLI